MAVTGESHGVIKMTADDDAVTGRKYVKYLRWVNATTADHACVVQDASGNEWWYSVADGANFIDIHPVYGWMNGITAETLDSGTLYAYLG